MTRYIIFFPLFFLSHSPLIFSQNQNEKTESYQKNLTAFSDYRNYFFVFDDGVFKQLEHHPVKEFKIGGNCVTYIDNSDNLKTYYKGFVHLLSANHPKEYVAMGKKVVFLFNKTLSVFDDGETRILSTAITNYFWGDSILCFYDENEAKVKVYQDGIKADLEGVLVDNIISISNIKAGDNILAYKGHDNSFKIYFRKQSIVLETTPPESHQPGKNIVAYEDGYSQSFRVFYNGSTEILEEVKPKSYKVGDNLVAYLDLSGNFKIFYDGNKYDISTFEPEFYEAKDNLVTFFDKNYFQVFYKGKIHALEKFVPASYKSDYSTLAYIDDLGYLKVFSEGQLQQISKETINKFEVTGNVVTYWTGINEVNIFRREKFINRGMNKKLLPKGGLSNNIIFFDN